MVVICCITVALQSVTSMTRSCLLMLVKKGSGVHIEKQGRLYKTISD